MSTSYFILSKRKDGHIADNSENQFFISEPRNTYFLPRCNLDYYTKNGLFEHTLIEWCKQFCSKDKYFIDIGAHTGTYTNSLSSYSKHVYAFEPQKMTFYALCGGVSLSGHHNITCIQKGLGSPNQIGPQTLKIVSNDGGGSSLHANTGILCEEMIDIQTLDSYHLSDIGFIKMDVEDNELHVLEGGKETIKRCKPVILFESNTDNPTLFHYVRNEFNYTIHTIHEYMNMFLATYNGSI